MSDEVKASACFAAVSTMDTCFVTMPTSITRSEVVDLTDDPANDIDNSEHDGQERDGDEETEEIAQDCDSKQEYKPTKCDQGSSNRTFSCSNSSASQSSSSSSSTCQSAESRNSWVEEDSGSSLTGRAMDSHCQQTDSRPMYSTSKFITKSIPSCVSLLDCCGSVSPQFPPTETAALLERRRQEQVEREQLRQYAHQHPYYDGIVRIVWGQRLQCAHCELFVPSQDIANHQQYHCPRAFEWLTLIQERERINKNGRQTPPFTQSVGKMDWGCCSTVPADNLATTPVHDKSALGSDEMDITQIPGIKVEEGHSKKRKKKGRGSHCSNNNQINVQDDDKTVIKEIPSCVSPSSALDDVHEIANDSCCQDDDNDDITDEARLVTMEAQSLSLQARIVADKKKLVEKRAKEVKINARALKKRAREIQNQASSVTTRSKSQRRQERQAERRKCCSNTHDLLPDTTLSTTLEAQALAIEAQAVSNEAHAIFHEAEQVAREEQTVMQKTVLVQQKTLAFHEKLQLQRGHATIACS